MLHKINGAMKYNDTTLFFFFMWNRWDEKSCSEIFGNESEHIWKYWCELYETHGSSGAITHLYLALSDINRNKLVKYAVNSYKSKNNQE